MPTVPVVLCTTTRLWWGDVELDLATTPTFTSVDDGLPSGKALTTFACHKSDVLDAQWVYNNGGSPNGVKGVYLRRPAVSESFVQKLSYTTISGWIPGGLTTFAIYDSDADDLYLGEYYLLILYGTVSGWTQIGVASTDDYGATWTHTIVATTLEAFYNAKIRASNRKVWISAQEVDAGTFNPSYYYAYLSVDQNTSWLSVICAKYNLGQEGLMAVSDSRFDLETNGGVTCYASGQDVRAGVPYKYWCTPELIDSTPDYLDVRDPEGWIQADANLTAILDISTGGTLVAMGNSQPSGAICLATTITSVTWGDPINDPTWAGVLNAPRLKYMAMFPYGMNDCLFAMFRTAANAESCRLAYIDNLLEGTFHEKTGNLPTTSATYLGLYVGGTTGRVYTFAVQMDETTDAGRGTPLHGDRAVFDALTYQDDHANDIDEAAGIHHTLGTGAANAAAGNHTHASPPAHALDDHSDVDALAPNDGDVLTWDDCALAWVPAAGGMLPVYTGDVSSPPTDAELDSAIGAPAAVGAGYAAILDDGGAGTAVYLVVSDGANWWHQALTKAT